MLNTSYSVGSSAYAWVFTKQFDAENKSHFAQQGVTASNAREMSVQHQTNKGKQNRHLVDVSATYPVAGSTSGQVYTDRVYLVVQRSPYTSDADIKGHIATSLALFGTTAFQTAVLNKEV